MRYSAETMPNGRDFISPTSFGGRVAIVLLALSLALTTVVSSLVIAEFHDHDCSGDECPICLVLSVAQALISSTSTAGVAQLSIALMMLVALALVTAREFSYVFTTPVTRGDKLII